MDKLKMQSLDVIGSNIKKMQHLFPNCVTERLGKDGKLELAIDFEKLQDELSNEIIGEGEERYQFTWPDKRAANRLANTPTTKTLRPCREESVDFDHTQNIYIEGDNLDVLKALRETYLGKVKMIYIDPPYNTGNDFVYNDDFAQSRDEFEKASGLFDEEGNQTIDPMQRNTESNGRFHTDWLNMIYPRLKVARDLLTDDGVIFISIDDNEQKNLKNVCDEVFGEKNFVCSFNWQKKTGSSDAKHIAIVTEYILTYSKNISTLSVNSNYEAFDEKRYRYKDEYFEERGPFYYDSLDRGTLGYHESLDYPIKINGITVFPNGRDCALNDGWRWKWSKDKVEWGIKNGFIVIQPASNKVSGYGAYYKIYLNVDNENKKINRSSPYKNIIQGLLNTNASSESKELFNSATLFSNPKPVGLLYLLLKIGSVKEDSIILDFFSGSSTTAHAVMKLNAEDGGNRKFIMVQLPEKTDEKSEAYKAGYKNICEIGQERIRRAGKKIKEELVQKAATVYNKLHDMCGGAIDSTNPSAINYWREKASDEEKCKFAALQREYQELDDRIKSFDTGFRVLKLDSSNMEDVYYTPQEFTMQSLFNENVKADRTGEDLLFQVMLDFGIALSAKIEIRKIAGKTVYLVDDNYLAACFDRDVTEATITEIAKLHPVYFVMRDASAANDNVIDNFEQLFEAYSKDTVRKVL